MTESDWLSCTSRPSDMLRQVRHRAAARKLRLLCCECCRLVWDHIPGVGAAAVAVVERYHDGLAGEPEFAEARAGLRDLYSASDGLHGSDGSAGFAGLVAAYAAMIGSLEGSGVETCLGWVQTAASRAAPEGEKQSALNHTRRQICDLFREVIGNPFRPWKAVPDHYGGGVVQPDGRTVKLTDTARRLAEGIRADQAFDRLPILADALEEAGITDAEMLAHCRRDGGHVRGCWALDVVLGKV